MKVFTIQNNKKAIFNADEYKILNNERIKVHLVESKIDIYNDIARIMANKIKLNNEQGIVTCFILPVGPRGQYQRFARICNIERISCKNLITINMDEYLDDDDELIPLDNPLSFRGFMKKNLYDLLDKKLRIKSENMIFPDPKNLSNIEEIINKTGKVDICFGGVGINGHIGFNEPVGDGFISPGVGFKNSKTRILELSTATITINSIRYGGYMELIPGRCVTIGMDEIFMADELRFYLEHDWQAAALQKIIFDKPNSNFPASFLKEHRKSSITVSRNVLESYGLNKCQ